MLGTSSAANEIDIEFRQVTKRFDEVIAVDDVSLSVKRGAFFSFLGPSGCGKTTSLRLIAGFDQPTQGNVYIGGNSVVGIPSHKRPVNMVFQQYALFPHMNVEQNIAYGLRQRKPSPSKSEIVKRVEETLEKVRLGGYGKRKIWELSGGQQQRVALARALINKPTCLLLDEPLAALDRKLRREMQIELQTLQRDVGITFILVTHDQEEALSMSDNICIMHKGKIVQTGNPRELYDEPKNRYVADFIGKSNFFDGIVDSIQDSRATVKLDNGQFLFGTKSNSGNCPAAGDRACIAVRPEMISITATDDTSKSENFVTKGIVTNRIFLGEHSEYLVATQQYGEIMVLSPKSLEITNQGFAIDETVSLGWSPGVALLLGEF